MQNRLLNKNTIIAASTLLLFAFVFSFQCSNNIFHIGDVGTDSSVFKYVGRVILDGGMPYKDTFDHKGPLIYLINVMGLLIGSQRGIWAVELCVIYLSLILFYRLARLQCGSITSLFITLFCSALLFKYFEGGNLVEEYALPLIAFSIYIFSEYYENHRITSVKVVFCGMAFGAICLLRINMISIWAVMCLGIVFDCFRDKKIKDLFKYSGLFLVGAGIVIIPVFVWLVKGDAFNDFLDCYWTFNRMYSERNSVAFSGTIFFNFLNNSSILLIVITFFIHILRERRLFDILYLVYIGMELMMISLSGNYYMHYGMVLVPAMVYPTSCVVNRIQKIKVDSFLIVVIAVLILSSSAIPSWCNAASDVFNDYATRRTSFISNHYYHVASVIEHQTMPEDRIIVCDNDDFYYNLSNRFAATKYSYMTNPLKVNEKYRRDCYNAIEDDLPKLIILPNDYFDYDSMISIIKRNNYSLIDRIVKESWGDTRDDNIIDIYVLEE